MILYAIFWIFFLLKILCIEKEDLAFIKKARFYKGLLMTIFEGATFLYYFWRNLWANKFLLVFLGVVAVYLWHINYFNSPVTGVLISVIASILLIEPSNKILLQQRYYSQTTLVLSEFNFFLHNFSYLLLQTYKGVKSGQIGGAIFDYSSIEENDNLLEKKDNYVIELDPTGIFPIKTSLTGLHRRIMSIIKTVELMPSEHFLKDTLFEFSYMRDKLDYMVNQIKIVDEINNGKSDEEKCSYEIGTTDLETLNLYLKEITYKLNSADLVLKYKASIRFFDNFAKTAIRL